MKLKPWYDVVKPREDLRQNKPLDAAEFAVHLDQIRDNRARIDYQDPERFLERTYLTRTLKDLAAQVVRRLSGEAVETSAVFNMATQFGGGKTHALSLLYHLAHAGPAAHEWSGVRSVLDQAHVKVLPRARVAAFVGQQFDPIHGRGADQGEPVRRTPWGEIAWQLGGERSLKVVATHDEKGVAPGGDAIRAMLPEGPCLILMDEVLNYIGRVRELGDTNQFYYFLQNLSEEVRARSDVVLAASIPKSETTEMTPDDEADFQRLKHLLERLGKAVLMSAGTETSEIIRRRLFEWGGLPNDAKDTARAFSDWALAHKSQLGAYDVESVRERCQASYPFHPSLLSVFERKWQTLRRFQKTRGILRLLALWVSNAYDRGYKETRPDPLIGLGTAPLDDPYFRAAVFEELGTSELEGPVTTDIAGNKDAIAGRLDRDLKDGDPIRAAQLHRKVATVIFFESNGGQTQDTATLPEVRAAVGGPDLDIGLVETVLDALLPSCHYLVPVGTNSYKFSPVPNLNKMLTDRKATVSASKVDERVREVVLKEFKTGGSSATLERTPFPESSGKVDDHPCLHFVILAPHQEAGLPETQAFVEDLVRHKGTSRRTHKSGLIFVAPASERALKEEATTDIAWRDIAGDTEARKRLDEVQLDEVATKVKNAARDLKDEVWKTYSHLLYLDKDGTVKEKSLGQSLTSTAPSLVDYILTRLLEGDEVVAVPGVKWLNKAWPQGFQEWSTKSARDAFFASPLLPRLLKPDAIATTIADAINNKQFGFAIDLGEGRYGDVVFEPAEGFSVGTIQFRDDEILLKPQRAKELVQPPHLARIEVRPATSHPRPGETVQFRLAAFDQRDADYPCPEANWTTTGGTITADGRLTAESVGHFEVRASAGGQEATGQVTVWTAPPPTTPPPPSGFSWKGAVPPQKWMNFYTKVLSRFASQPGLKLEVSFQVGPDEGASEAKIEEAKAALRELGLSEDGRAT